MNVRLIPACASLLFLLKLSAAALAQSSPVVPVKLVHNASGYSLLRDGKPYFVKGAGGSASKIRLAAAGANSFRTWGIDTADADFSDAEKSGLTISLGIWLGHMEHGFNYRDPVQVAAQFKKVREIILKYKDRSPLLVWSIGNEMEGAGGIPEIYKAVNEIAKVIKELDPNHPTMTVIAELGGNKVQDVHRFCPDIDILGINSYGGGETVAERYLKVGGTKPYILTEYGPPGVWEIAKTSWGAAPELSSTAKAAVYKNVYQKSVLSPTGLCLGSYAFTWGSKQEATATWFGLLLPNGSRLGAVDALQELWTGKPSTSKCPEIDSIAVIGNNEGAPGSTMKFALKSHSAEGAKLSTTWVLQKEAGQYGSNGDIEATPPEFRNSIVISDDNSVEIKLPTALGGYRVFAYVHDTTGAAATANVPIFVRDPESLKAGLKTSLPVVIYAEGKSDKLSFTPSGYMGNSVAVKMNPDCNLNPHSGKSCLQVDYSAGDQWAGVVWQSPVNDWGDQYGGWNWTGAKRLSFWARGENGDEWITFQYGILGKEKKFYDTAGEKIGAIKLSKDWTKYTFNLDGKDLTRIKTGFSWVLAGQGHSLRFWLDDIIVE